jgi:hypothetical protein
MGITEFFSRIKVISAKIITGLIILIFAVSCAKVGSISGGPKDTIPPQVVSSTPPMYTTNYKGKKITITFDEFIALKNFDKEFNVSPPLKKNPKVWIKDKSIVIQYSDTLIDNITYSFNFGNSIVDNNEGNILSDYEFVFSTGDKIDSLGLYGTVVDALTRKPLKDRILIALYSDLSDSAPIIKKPVYTARTKEKGIFSMFYIKEGKYRLFAFNDKNFNYRYDPYNENFAFFDSVINLNSSTILSHTVPLVIDTLFARDSTKKQVKNIKIDSLKLRNLRNSLHVDLNLFTENNPRQFIKNYYRPEKNLLILKFNNPLLKDSIQLMPLYQKLTGKFLLEAYETPADSILIWLTDSMFYKSDTLRLTINYSSSKGRIMDTLMFRYLPKETKIITKNTPRMKLLVSASQVIDLNKPISIETQYPIVKANPDNIELKKQQDSVFINQPFQFVQDSVMGRKFYLINQWESEKSYKLNIYPSAFENIYQIPSDTIKLQFKTQRSENYGTLYIQPENFFYPCIVQLLQNDKVMYEKYFPGSQRMIFDYLQAGEYNIRVIFDEDGNRKFTTGDYFKHKQPEPTFLYNAPVKIRSNWEVEINWKLK